MKYRRWFVFLAHVVLAALCYYGAFLLRFDGVIPRQQWDVFIITLPLAVILKVSSMAYFRLHQGLWRYASMGDLLMLFKACSISTAAFVVAVVFTYGHGYPRSVFAIDWMLSFVVFGGVRLTYRIIHEVGPQHQARKSGARTLIVGAGNCGEMALRDLRRSNAATHNIIGFLDDNDAKLDATIHGVPVIGTTSEISRIVAENDVHVILIAMPSASKHVVREIVESCTGHNIRFKIIPSIRDIVTGKLQVQQARDVQVEDLLGRDAIHLEHHRVSENLRNKAVLVTGAGGSIGSELVRQIATYKPKRLILIEIAETALFEIEEEMHKNFSNLPIKAILADINNRTQIEEIFRRYRPAIVYHAAAYKHVPLMERHPLAAIQNNVFGTRNVVDTAIKYGAEQFLLISTDKAVNPKNTMGATKRCAEMILATTNSYNTKLNAVRFGNVLGSNGSVIPTFRRQIAEGGPVRVTHPEVTRFFLTIPEAVELVLQAGAISGGGETFLLEMGDPIKIVDLARNMIELSGLVVGEDIEIVYTGLRPGEKLHEELVATGETVCVTAVPKVMEHKPNSIDARGFREKLAMLEEAVRNRDEEIAVNFLMDIITTYDKHSSIQLKTSFETTPTPYQPMLKVVNEGD